MGNCLVLHPKTIQIVKPDGKVLEYQNPVKVGQVLSDFPCHGMLETPPLSAADPRYLSLETTLQRGRSYYLVPLLPPGDAPRKKKKKTKKVRFADASDSERAGDGAVTSGTSPSDPLPHPSDGVVRIKLVISKRELMEMMGEGGVSVSEELMCQIMSGRTLPGHQEDVDHSDVGCCEDCCKGWKPSLEIIHEK